MVQPKTFSWAVFVAFLLPDVGVCAPSAPYLTPEKAPIRPSVTLGIAAFQIHRVGNTSGATIIIFSLPSHKFADKIDSVNVALNACWSHS